MTRVGAPSRLHFGLLHVPAEGVDRWPDGLPARRFGGVGLMVEEPGVVVRVEPADEWSATGPAAARAMEFARRAVGALPPDARRPVRVTVERCPPEHVGLGVGTQLGLAVAAAVKAAWHGERVGSAVELARAVGRGLRSGVGLYGFDRGGLVVDLGKGPADDLPTLLDRYHLPSDWRVVLARPPADPTWHGEAERGAFARRRDPAVLLRHTERLSRLLLLGVIPAALGRDFPAFAAAVHEYNREAGAVFADDQGGAYAGPAVADLVESARSLGFPGAGQSSWGPTAFVLAEDPDRADWFAGRLRGSAELDVIVTTVSESGATVDSRP